MEKITIIAAFLKTFQDLLGGMRNFQFKNRYGFEKGLPIENFVNLELKRTFCLLYLLYEFHVCYKNIYVKILIADE